MMRTPLHANTVAARVTLTRAFLVIGLSFMLFFGAVDLIAQCGTGVDITSPAAGATGVPADTGTLRWTVASQHPTAEFFRIYFETAVRDGCNFLNTTTTVGGRSLAAAYRDLLPNTAYQLRVEAYRNNVCYAASPCITFTTGCASKAPTLFSPPNGGGFDRPRVVFDWGGVPGATRYHLFVSVNGAAPVEIGSTVGTTLTRDIPPSSPAGTASHSWFVEAEFDGCPSTRSITQTFRTGCPSETPTPVRPARGAHLPSGENVTFQWTEVFGANGYNVYVEPAGGSPIKIGETRDTNVPAATTLTASLPPGNSFTWFVDAVTVAVRNPVLTTPPCPNRGFAAPFPQFTVAQSCPAAGPSLRLPDLGTTVTSRTVTFSWDPPSNAGSGVNYNLQVRLRGANEPVTMASTSATSATVDLPNGTHFWSVQATSTSCPPMSSSERSITVDVPTTCPSGPTLVSPDNGALGVTNPVLFSWSPVAGATAYELTAGSAVVHTTSTTAAILLPVGVPINWNVAAFVGSCRAVSETRTVTAAASACASTAPRLIEPTEGVLTRGPGDAPITFLWSAVPFASSYDIRISVNGSPATSANVPGPPFAVSGAALLGGLPTANISWTVSANFTGCPAATSSPATFILRAAEACNLAAPALIAPAADSRTMNTVVTFNWSAVNRATEYRVYVVNPADPNNPILAGKTNGDTTLQSLRPIGSFSWYVEAHAGTACTPGVSQRRVLTIEQAANCSSRPAPVLATPSDDSTVSNPVQFTWDAAAGAIGYRLLLGPAGGTLTPVTDVTTDRSALFVVPEGENEWAVEAIFAGCPAVRSASRVVRVAVCSINSTSLSEPVEGGETPESVTLKWTPAAGATSYEILLGANSDSPTSFQTVPAGSNTRVQTQVTANLVPGPYTWLVRARAGSCFRDSAAGHFTVVATAACAVPAAPEISVQGQVSSGAPYTVSWNPINGATRYELLESTTGSFESATTIELTGTSMTFSHGSPFDTTFYYRVRVAESTCTVPRGEFSNVAEVDIQGSSPPRSGDRAGTPRDATLEFGTTGFFLNSVFYPYAGPPTPFTATTDRDFVTVEPSSGVMMAPGLSFTLLVNASDADLLPGANDATLTVSLGGSSSGRVGTQQTTTTTTTPLSVNLVTPVLPGGKDTPPADAIIIPAVASLSGANNSQFQSDVRITNTSAETARYTVFFTPSGSNAALNGKMATVEVAAGKSIAMDNLLRTWYGVPAGQSISGALEVRSSRSGASLPNNLRTLLGSSRTFNSTPDGTFGQFIPAVPFSRFPGKGQILTLNSVAESARYRTNLSLVEGSGQPATVRITINTPGGVALTSFTVQLQPGEQTQLNAFLRSRGIVSDNARVDVEVISDTGRVSAFASVVDNKTNDPYLVMPSNLATISETRYALPGVADIDGIASWRTDLTVTNGGSSPVNATLTFHPSENPADSETITQRLEAGETKLLDNVLQAHFHRVNTGGSVVVSTPGESKLMTSARTYNETGNGTFGQFIPGVGAKAGIGADGGVMQVQQLEESPAFRSNVGLAEISGNAARVEITAVLPDTKVVPRITLDLRPNEFRQFGSLMRSLGLTNVYNARVAVRVISGTGRITAYGSVIDNKTQDPTFIPGEY